MTGIRTGKRGEEFGGIEGNHPKCGLGQVHRRQHNLRMLIESSIWGGGVQTFEAEASKQTSSPILERPRRIRERGRMELDGTLASNNVVEAITILLAHAWLSKEERVCDRHLAGKYSVPLN